MSCIPAAFLPARLLAADTQPAPEPRGLLKLVKTIPLPGVTGRIDHLAYDIGSSRLFVAALGNNTVEIVDLAGGKVIGQIKDIPEPQGILFLPQTQQLVVSSAAEGSIRFYDGKSLQLLKTINLGKDADNIRADPAFVDRVYVGYGDGAIAAIDAKNMAVLGETKLKAHPEAFALEDGPRVFVNLPAAQAVAVFDRRLKDEVQQWPLTDAQENYPMVLHAETGRLFIGCRKPGKLLVLDIESGTVVASAPLAGDVDDVFFDHRLHRVYAACGEGYLDVFAAELPRLPVSQPHGFVSAKPASRPAPKDYRLERIAHLPTAPGARTGLFVPSAYAFYLAVPHKGQQEAEIRVYKPDF